MNTKTRLWPALMLFAFTACTKSDTLKESILENEKGAVLNQEGILSLKKGNITYKAVRYKADYITDAGSGKAGKTIYFWNVGNKQMDVDFVPGDPYRGGRTDITYTIDNEMTHDNGLSTADIVAAIESAMDTWEAQNCSKLEITKIPYSGNLGWVSTNLGFGGNIDFVADIQHSGFLPAEFFDALTPGGSSSILAITFSFIWTDENGATDMDKNGKADLAFSEIYYNDAFDWRTNTGSGYDIETVALHEAGHGLAQDHFGKAFSTDKNGKLHIAPRAVMNAAYTSEQRSLLGTDKAGHCSIWSNWPQQ